jgi:hypothetical protein
MITKTEDQNECEEKDAETKERGNTCRKKCTQADLRKEGRKEEEKKVKRR